MLSLVSKVPLIGYMNLLLSPCNTHKASFNVKIYSVNIIPSSTAGCLPPPLLVRAPHLFLLWEHAVTPENCNHLYKVATRSE